MKAGSAGALGEEVVQGAAGGVVGVEGEHGGDVDEGSVVPAAAVAEVDEAEQVGDLERLREVGRCHAQLGGSVAGDVGEFVFSVGGAQVGEELPGEAPVGGAFDELFEEGDAALAVGGVELGVELGELDVGGSVAGVAVDDLVVEARGGEGAASVGGLAGGGEGGVFGGGGVVAGEQGVAVVDVAEAGALLVGSVGPLAGFAEADEGGAELGFAAAVEGGARVGEVGASVEGFEGGVIVVGGFVELAEEVVAESPARAVGDEALEVADGVFDLGLGQVGGGSGEEDVGVGAAVVDFDGAEVEVAGAGVVAGEVAVAGLVHEGLGFLAAVEVAFEGADVVLAFRGAEAGDERVAGGEAFDGVDVGLGSVSPAAGDAEFDDLDDEVGLELAAHAAAAEADVHADVVGVVGAGVVADRLAELAEQVVGEAPAGVGSADPLELGDALGVFAALDVVGKARVQLGAGEAARVFSGVHAVGVSAGGINSL